MKRSDMPMQSILRVSSALIILGLVAEIVSLVWFHPLAFVEFVFIGGSLVGLGMLTYLFSLLFVATPVRDSRDPSSQ